MATMTTWVSKHFISYDIEIPSSDTDQNYLVSYGANRYELDAGHDGKQDWSCTCPDWTHRRSKSGGYCKHILHVQGLSPAQGGRSLWRSNGIDRPISVPSAESLKQLENILNAPADEVSVADLLEGANAVIASIKHYTPVAGVDGKLIPAVIVPEETVPRVSSHREGDTHVIVIQGTAPTTIRKNGELPSDAYALWLTYQDIQSDALREACKDLGFDPEQYYTLQVNDDDKSTPCSDCGSYMVRLHSIDPIHDGYVCANATCLRSVNHPQNKTRLYRTALLAMKNANSGGNGGRPPTPGRKQQQ